MILNKPKSVPVAAHDGTPELDIQPLSVVPAIPSGDPCTREPHFVAGRAKVSGLPLDGMRSF